MALRTSYMPSFRTLATTYFQRLASTKGIPQSTFPPHRHVQGSSDDSRPHCPVYTIVFSYSSITNHRSPCHLPSFPFSSVSSLFDRYQRIFYDLHFYRTLALILSYPSGFLLPHAVYYVSTFFSPFYPISYRCRQRRTMQRRLVIFCSSRRLCVFPSNTSLQRSFPCLIIC